MSLALLGIILVQVYWIQNTITQKEQVFNYQVNEALNKAADKVETSIAASVLSSQMSLFFSDSALWAGNGDSLTSYTDFMGDTVFAAIIRSSADVNALTEDGMLAERPLNDRNSPIQEIAGKPTMILEPLEYETGFEAANNDLITDILRNIDKQLQINSNRIKKAMEQMMFKMMERGIHPEQKVDTTFLRNTLNHELSNRGLTTEYNFGVLLNNGYLISDASGNDELKELSTSVHKVSLFPDDIYFNNDVLLISFPNQQSFILSSIWSLLIGSLLFTTIIIAIFYYTVVVLVRQKKLSEIKNDFINNMTHEFKTPLATISLAVDAVNNPMILRDENKVKHYTGIIKEENRRMNSQVEKVLQMALLDRNRIQISLEDVDIHEIIYRAVENISLPVEEKGGKITTRLEAENYEISGDEVHLMNVIHNLLDNANKYSPVTPDITVTTRSDKKGIFISVSDKGIGMSQEHQKMIFEKFYRVPTGNVHDIKGFGLGLTYVKAVVEAHGGTIEVKSQPKKGSEFTMFLPYSI
jgi:two-component system phosphate regulon sensor histidine kinase PhoR